MNPQSLDQVITSAARSLVARDPSPRLRASVDARLGERATSTLTWLAVPAAAAVLTVAVLSLPTGSIELPDVPPTSSPAVQAPSAAVVAGTSVDPFGSARSPVPASPVALDAAPVSAAEVAWLADMVPPLRAPAALTVSVSQPEPVTIALLEVHALATPPLSVPPLGMGRAPREP
jgi:hypothetical protein